MIMTNADILSADRCIHVVHVLYAFGIGGMEKGVATIVRHASVGFRHTIMCLATSGLTEKLLPQGVTVYELHKPPGNSVVFLWKVARTLHLLQPDIVHTRNWGGTDGIIAARLAGIRRVVHGEHGWEMSDAEGANTKKLLFRRFLSRWVKEYTCVSCHQKTWLETLVNVKKPITQIYNGVDTDRFCRGSGGNRIRTELEIAPETFVVGVIGRLDPIKNHSILFRAFEELRTVSPDSRLLVVGDGSEQQRLEDETGVGILFLGNRSDVPEILQALNVFVLPSKNEGISNTILEAMAAELPVVATDVGGNAELVLHNETGMLVTSGESRQIALALQQYLANPELCRVHGKQGRERVLRDFSIDQMVQGYETVYKRVFSQL